MLRLAPHHRLYRVAVDEWRHVTPALEFHRVSGPDGIVADVAARLAAYGVADPHDPAEDGAGADDPGAPLVRLLRDRGALTASRDDVPWPLPGTGPVAIRGTGPVAGTLRALLGDRALGIAPDDAVPATACALVSVAPEQPDARWSALGPELARTGLPWHRVHQEGELLVVGPLQAPGGSGAVTYADYRGRRRAAHRVVEELDRLWREADARAAAGVAPPDAWHGIDAGVAALAAGIVIHELAEHLARASGTGDGADAPGVRYEHTIVVATGLVERHPVLPLPVDLAGPPAPAGPPASGAPSASTDAIPPADATGAGAR
ncbi:hypothetical protein [Clavibacter michiganensis]|uniref:Uncharacterized protein n=1 Tax=Clavibacter michiganensis TaxID=28447 RepID=A0A251YTI6_9MICO|nr:hypothetical protein [Clavibacter michiganensis]OUE27577.1 hypothetical protein BFL37_01470 [Clavibacter michiganensis]